MYIALKSYTSCDDFVLFFTQYSDKMVTDDVISMHDIFSDKTQHFYVCSFKNNNKANLSSKND